jgi:hypothetical protein
LLKRERKPFRFWWNVRKGSSGVPDDLVLSKTAGARDET